MLRKRGEHIKARQRSPLRDTFEQAGIAIGSHRRQRQQIELAGENARRRWHVVRAQRLRNTRVPLVPPKPNPLETAIEIFFSRATFGT